MTDSSQLPEFPDLGFASYDEATAEIRARIYGTITQFALAHLFGHPIAQRQVYIVTGNGPFEESDLRALLERAGMYSDDTVDRLSELPTAATLEHHYMIVGRNDSSIGPLDWALEQLADEPGSLLILSQEDFLNHWLFGRYTPYTRSDLRVWEHSALRYLAEHSGPRWPWPSTEPEPSLGGELDANGWLRVHPLKGRFGYTVGAKENLSDRERQRRLDMALNASDQPLTLQAVVKHIAWQVRWKRSDPMFANAVAKWERDLAYLKQKYYRNQFFWPETE